MTDSNIGIGIGRDSDFSWSIYPDNRETELVSILHPPDNVNQDESSVTSNESESSVTSNESESSVTSNESEKISLIRRSVANFTKATGISETMVTSVAGWAILGCVVGSAGGPIGIAAGFILGVVIGGVLAHLASKAELKDSENIKQKPAEGCLGRTRQLLISDATLGKIARSMGLDEDNILKISDFAILGAILGLAGGPVGVAVGVAGGAILGMILSKIVTYMKEEDGTGTTRGGEILQSLTSLAKKMGMSDEMIGNIAWLSILGADTGYYLGPLLGPVGIIAGPIVGAVIGTIAGIILTELPHSNNVDQKPSTTEGKSIFTALREKIGLDEDSIAKIGGFAIVGIILGSCGGPIGAAAGLAAGTLVGMMFVYMHKKEEKDSSLHTIPNQNMSSMKDVKNTCGGDELQSIKEWWMHHGTGGGVVPVLEYAILGALVGGGQYATKATQMGHIGILAVPILTIIGAGIGVYVAIEEHKWHEQQHDHEAHETTY